MKFLCWWVGWLTRAYRRTYVIWLWTLLSTSSQVSSYRLVCVSSTTFRWRRRVTISLTSRRWDSLLNNSTIWLMRRVNKSMCCRWASWSTWVRSIRLRRRYSFYWRIVCSSSGSTWVSRRTSSWICQIRVKPLVVTFGWLNTSKTSPSWCTNWYISHPRVRWMKSLSLVCSRSCLSCYSFHNSNRRMISLGCWSTSLMPMKSISLKWSMRSSRINCWSSSSWWRYHSRRWNNFPSHPLRRCTPPTVSSCRRIVRNNSTWLLTYRSSRTYSRYSSRQTSLPFKPYNPWLGWSVQPSTDSSYRSSLRRRVSSSQRSPRMRMNWKSNLWWVSVYKVNQS